MWGRHTQWKPAIKDWWHIHVYIMSVIHCSTMIEVDLYNLVEKSNLYYKVVFILTFDSRRKINAITSNSKLLYKITLDLDEIIWFIKDYKLQNLNLITSMTMPLIKSSVRKIKHQTFPYCFAEHSFSHRMWWRELLKNSI